MNREKFIIGEIYHIFNKSIANFGIFKNTINTTRFIYVLDYYNNRLVMISYSDFIRRKRIANYPNLLLPKNNSYFKFLSYCIMPDHYHFLIKAKEDDVISKYINDIENSYSRFFNLKYKRKGPLWQSRFKAIRIESNDQLLHVSRYIHLNPTTKGLVKKPEDWFYSSYRDYIENRELLKNVLTEISIEDPKQYQKFVADRRDYQIKLREIKKSILD